MYTSKVVLHGGGASKVPSFFEEHWTAFQLVDVIIGLAEAITLEPPGTGGYGFEFFMDRAHGREWHQVKFQNAELGKWTLAALRKEGVLTAFKEKLQSDDKSSCVFVSAHAAHPFGKLCDNAAESTSLDQFINDFLSSQDLMEGFINLHNKEWEVDKVLAWKWLNSRVTTRTIDGRTLEDRISERAMAYFEQPASLVAMALAQVCKSILYSPADRAVLLEKLGQLGVRLRSADSPEFVLKTASNTFVSTMQRNFVNSVFIPRRAVDDIEDLLPRRIGSSVIVTGSKGCGKSAVLAEVVHRLVLAEKKVLMIDVARLTLETNSTDVGHTLGLTSSPVSLLARAAGAEHFVIVIDSLDSLALNRDKPLSLFKAIDEVIHECAAYPNLTLLISCRTQDLEVDSRLRTLVHEPDPAAVVNVGLLDEYETRAAVAASNHDLSRLSVKQLELLRNLANLRLFTELPPDSVASFETEQELIELFTEWLVR